MKTRLLFAALGLISYTVAAQGSWKRLGLIGPGVVSNPTVLHSASPVIATDTAGVPYVAYTSDGLKIMVSKFDGTYWQNFGTPYLRFRGWNPSIAISSRDSMYVGFRSYNDNENPMVIKYDGTNWVAVGNPISYGGGSLLNTSLAVDSNEKLYFGFAALFLPLAPIGHANIMTYDGTDWIPVGNTDFVKYTSRISLRIGLNNDLYVGYNTYYSPANSSWVQRWNGSQWDTIGQGLSEILDIDIAPDGTLYCIGGQAIGGYTVNKLVNNIWTQLGNTGIYSHLWQVKIDKLGVPHVIFGETGTQKISVKNYDGSYWNYVGQNAFTNFSVNNACMTFGKDNMPYVACESATSGGKTPGEKIYAWYYDSILTSIPVLNLSHKTVKVYPNPIRSDAAGFTINNPGLGKGEYDLGLYNCLGQALYKKKLVFKNENESCTIDLSENLSKGIYHIRLADRSKSYSTSLIVD